MAKSRRLGVEAGFFDEPTESSIVKQKIVFDYFIAWTNVLARQGRQVGYADLFAGRGKYKNGKNSTPILIAERVVEDERLRNSATLWFNEGNAEHYVDLRVNILSLPGIATLKFKPVFTNRIVGKWPAEALAKRPFSIPTLLFADPCGYKGLSLRLVSSALQGFGNDCLFFFNYRRVNMKLSFPMMDESLNEFFEPGRAAALRQEIERLKPRKREEAVLQAIREAIREAGGIPVVFAFRSREGGGTSHHLVFASKSTKGAGIMKSIMSRYSSEVIDGIGSWDFVPKDKGPKSLPLFSPLDEMRDHLLEEFAGRTLTFKQLVAEEAPRTQYTEANYREAVLGLEAEFRINVDPPSQERRRQSGEKRTLPESTKLTFST